MKALKSLVIFLAVLIVAATAVLVYEIVRRATSEETPALSGPASVSRGPGDTPVRLIVPEGAMIGGLEVTDNRLIVEIQGFEGETSVYVMDLETGRVVARIGAEGEPTRLPDGDEGDEPGAGVDR